MKRYWIAFWCVIVVSFLVLGWAGLRIYQEKPPIPAAYVTLEGQTVVTQQDIEAGQNVWQSMGGMEVGSVWGHGSYVAPDWTADWLHRECVYILNAWAERAHGKMYDSLSPEDRAAFQMQLTILIRKNTYDPSTGLVSIDSIRAAAFAANVAHYSEVFSKGVE
ncbi:MAG: nitric-oxide reductase large subunit, partial [Bacteroidota bacterium]